MSGVEFYRYQDAWRYQDLQLQEALGGIPHRKSHTPLEVNRDHYDQH